MVPKKVESSAVPTDLPTAEQMAVQTAACSVQSMVARRADQMAVQMAASTVASTAL